MPELAEVEFYRKQWAPITGKRILRVHAHSGKRIFRDAAVEVMANALTRRNVKASFAHGKQMLFQFTGGHWLSVHLGMTGKLFCEPLPYIPGKHDHLVIFTKTRAAVLNDPRLFGRLHYESSQGFPGWWRHLPPDLLSDAFTQRDMVQFLKRRKRSPIKAVLLMQERFPGIGNWMADEILWRAGVHPATEAGILSPRKQAALFGAIKEVCDDAMNVIGEDWSAPPDDWLFNHRWRSGGVCPKTNKPLKRETIGGRTTCWSPARQKL